MINTKCLGKILYKKKTLIFGLIIGLFVFGMIVQKTDNKTSDNSNMDLLSYIKPVDGLIEPQARPSKTEISNFVDMMSTQLLSYYNIPGMTVSFVMDDEIVLSKGFGRSDYLPPTFVHNQTLFRIGSVSKSFTAIAALQLVEDGILDLDTDINDYLTAFQIPETFPEPITLRHLLTHTPGFEEFPATVIYDMVVPQTVEEILITWMPNRVAPPGVKSSYSNYGMGLIGYLIQEYSGKSFEQYVEDEILVPLGMNHTTFKQPLPAVLAANMSNGYYEDIEEQFFEIVTLPSAGSCSSTASDLAIYMLTLLNNGTYNGTEILQSSTVDMMFNKQFEPHEDLPGVGFGLYQFYPNNVNVWGHGGDTIFFHSNMCLFPEEDLGFFISFNSYNGVYAKSEFLSAFIDTFYPYSSSPPTPMDDYDKGLNQFTGYYYTARRYYSDKDITDYLTEEVVFTWTPFDYIDTVLEITKNNSYLSLAELDFVQVEPDYFREATGEYDLEMAFVRDANGEVSYLYTNFMTTLVASEKMHPFYYESGPVLAVLIVVGSAYFLSLLWWVIEAIIDSRKKKNGKPFLQHLSKGLIAGVLILNAILIGIYYPMSNTKVLLDTDTISDLGGLIALPIIVIVLIAVMIALSVFSWIGIGNVERKPYGKLWERIHYLILIALSAVFIFAFAYWHFLGY
ncbi:MAG: beta-lactamase family protein [Candidatus Heimdallarchaeota archaeon]|nr:beta-lactamase family protein [Candidatus Heimdallarchaeota archaeon]